MNANCFLIVLFVCWQGIGDSGLAYQCFRLALAADNNHAEAYNNLGVIEMRKGRIEMVSYEAAHPPNTGTNKSTDIEAGSKTETRVDEAR